MYSDWVIAAGVVIFLWLGGMSFLVWKQGRFLKMLIPKSGERDVRKKFEELINLTQDFKNNTGVLKNKVEEIEKLGFGHIQKVSLFRFNPFEDTGGDQSFSIALLDNKGSGIVITSLHARSGTRVFAKEVICGKSGQYEFSKEEQEVIKEAINSKK